MRPLYHPPIEEITVQGILNALADPVRARIVIGLLGSEYAKNCTTFRNVNDTPLPKATLSKHFAILRESGLIRSERKGVELHNHVRDKELLPKFGAMIEAILQAYQRESEASPATK